MNLDAENARALDFQKNGDFDSAREILEKLVAQNPQNGALWGNLALILEDLGELPLAENAFLHSVFLGRDARLRSNYAAFLMKNFCGTRHNEALPHLEIALKMSPQNPVFWNALGVYFADQNEIENSQNAFEKALKINALYAPAKMNLAQLFLKKGDYAGGFKIGRENFSNAFRQMPPYESLPRGRYAPTWENKKSFENKELLIIPEQGLGDEIQMARFVPLLKEKLGFKKIHWVCRESLVDVLKTLPNVDIFEGVKTLKIHAHTFWQPHDFWCFLMDLAEILDFSPEKNTAALPYLEKSQFSTVNQNFFSKSAKKIGIVWRGNPKHSNDFARSIQNVEILESLFELKDFQFFSFQKNLSENEQKFLENQRVTNLADDLKTFKETAEFLTQMDFLVSVDSAVAHLAGAFGIPTFLLLPKFRSDWRWGFSGEKTFWYPNHRLIRQKTAQNWSAEIAQIRDFLKNG